MRDATWSEIRDWQREELIAADSKAKRAVLRICHGFQWAWVAWSVFVQIAWWLLIWPITLVLLGMAAYDWAKSK